MYYFLKRAVGVNGCNYLNHDCRFRMLKMLSGAFFQLFVNTFYQERFFACIPSGNVCVARRTPLVNIFQQRTSAKTFISKESNSLVYSNLFPLSFGLLPLQFFYINICTTLAHTCSSCSITDMATFSSSRFFFDDDNPTFVNSALSIPISPSPQFFMEKQIPIESHMTCLLSLHTVQKRDS